MRLSLSTNWNSRNHETGEAMLDEIVALGFDQVELGYALTFGQAEGVRRRVKEGAIKISSVHGFCPFPIPEAESSDPEPFSFCNARDFAHRREAIHQAIRSLEFAAELGAPAVVFHAGRADIHRRARKLNEMVKDGRRGTPKYERRLAAFQEKRERRGRKPLETLHRELDVLLPEADRLGVNLCLENLPSGDGLPNEVEMMQLLHEYEGSRLRYWHDAGHAQIRHELGLIHHAGWVKRIAPHIGGFHLHDVEPPLRDHTMPPGGLVKFEIFQPFVATDVPMVLEPMRNLDPEKLRTGLAYMRNLWGIAE